MKAKDDSYTVAKHLRKARVSASIDIEAQRLLERMSNADVRSPSNLINKLIYDEAKRRGIPIPDKADKE